MKLELPEHKKWVHELVIPIRWGDMDAMGHVNNTVYFRYFESARIEYLRSLGSMPEAKVTVMRNGRTTDLMLNLTQALNDAEPLIGTAGMPTTEQQPQMPAQQQ